MKKSKIVFANQKGGVGKSTLCILFANYLAWKKLTCIIDTDLQKTIMSSVRRTLNLRRCGGAHSVQDFDVQDPVMMQQLMDSASQTDGFVLFDSLVMCLKLDWCRCLPRRLHCLPYEYEEKDARLYGNVRAGGQCPATEHARHGAMLSLYPTHRTCVRYGR